MIAANMKPMLAEEAKKRQLATLKKGTGSPVQVIFPERDKGQARDQAGLRWRSPQDSELLAMMGVKIRPSWKEYTDEELTATIRVQTEYGADKERIAGLRRTEDFTKAGIDERLAELEDQRKIVADAGGRLGAPQSHRGRLKLRSEAKCGRGVRV